ncbi:MAG TPA: response regulator [Candidatus Nanoarchaeia archaeon]|nr:response regulator [Candidatus Nanoarchaeia archaeon]
MSRGCGEACRPDGVSVATKTVLFVARRSRACERRCAALEKAGFRVIIADNILEALTIFVSQTVNAVLLDAEFGGARKNSLRGHMSSIRPHVPLIVMSGDHDIATQSYAHVFRKQEGTNKLVQLVRLVVE